MTLQEAQSVLKLIAEDTPNKQALPEVRQQLGECLFALQRETMFQSVPPGTPVPMMRYEIVEAQDFVEKAINALKQNDRTTMLEHVQNAASRLLRVI